MVADIEIIEAVPNHPNSTSLMKHFGKPYNKMLRKRIKRLVQENRLSFKGKNTFTPGQALELIEVCHNPTQVLKHLGASVTPKNRNYINGLAELHNISYLPKACDIVTDEEVIMAVDTSSSMTQVCVKLFGYNSRFRQKIIKEVIDRLGLEYGVDNPNKKPIVIEDAVMRRAILSSYYVYEVMDKIFPYRHSRFSKMVTEFMAKHNLDFIEMDVDQDGNLVRLLYDPTDPEIVALKW